MPSSPSVANGLPSNVSVCWWHHTTPSLAYQLARWNQTTSSFSKIWSFQTFFFLVSFQLPANIYTFIFNAIHRLRIAIKPELILFLTIRMARLAILFTLAQSWPNFICALSLPYTIHVFSFATLMATKPSAAPDTHRTPVIPNLLAHPLQLPRTLIDFLKLLHFDNTQLANDHPQNQY